MKLKVVAPSLFCSQLLLQTLIYFTSSISRMNVSLQNSLTKWSRLYSSITFLLSISFAVNHLSSVFQSKYNIVLQFNVHAKLNYFCPSVGFLNSCKQLADQFSVHH